MTPRRTIFVTGAGSGIGRAIALHFGHQGWFVGLGDNDPDRMYETERMLPGGYSYAYWMDVRRRDEWDDALRVVARASGGQIDVVANNAGVAESGTLMDLSDEQVEHELSVNLSGAIHGARAAYRYLKETAPGSCLVNTSSASGLYGVPGLNVYGATKAALKSLSESLDAEWAADGIRVRCLMPGFVDTPLLDGHIGPVTVRDHLKALGLEVLSPEQVAQAAWDAVHGDKLHWPVGKDARRLTFAARWLPGRLRRQMRQVAAKG
ncbi:SDR family oxidoreductase [Altericroceibacterium xinjiangense]|uniref:SDR family oxidoreductase n=1 Tax=Altericroceibacterium xinjiangense TaxID=762261 RepID=UPI000F7D91E2|nr:SDR family oxidoreductase [Altericroceibacterium xinjiangense]